MPITESGPWRSVIPGHADHLFRGDPNQLITIVGTEIAMPGMVIHEYPSRGVAKAALAPPGACSQSSIRVKRRKEETRIHTVPVRLILLPYCALGSIRRTLCHRNHVHAEKSVDRRPSRHSHSSRARSSFSLLRDLDTNRLDRRQPFF